MRTSIAHAGRYLLLVLLAAPLTAASQDPERSRTQGLKETDRFVKAGGNTSEAVAKAKNQVQATLDAYNALVTQPSKNMKGDYKKLLKSSDAMDDRLAEVRKKVEEMQKAGDTYFSGRAVTIKNIQDPSLRTRAEERMTASRKEFAEVLKSLRDTNEALEPFRKELADQVTYLGSDLTPSAMESLRPNAAKLNARGADIFKRADSAIGTANTYFQSLKATQT